MLNGGTLRYNGPDARITDRLFCIGTSGATLNSSGTDNANPLIFLNPGALGFNSQTGTRTLTLTGANTATNTSGRDDRRQWRCNVR